MTQTLYAHTNKIKNFLKIFLYSQGHARWMPSSGKSSAMSHHCESSRSLQDQHWALNPRKLLKWKWLKALSFLVMKRSCEGACALHLLYVISLHGYYPPFLSVFSLALVFLQSFCFSFVVKKSIIRLWMWIQIMLPFLLRGLNQHSVFIYSHL
jgi:hypothetical protein